MTSYKKQSIIYAIVLVIILNAATFAVSSNIETTEYEEAARVLSALEIIDGYEDGVFDPEETINRAEFAIMTARMLGLKDMPAALTTEKIFTDVESSSRAAGYIKAIADLNIISGYGDNRFGPEEPIIYEQAIKVIVSILGYDMYAVQRGGYPAGYMAIAAEKGITKRANGIVGQPAKRGLIVQLLYNALEVDLLQQTGYGAGVTYTVVSNQSLLSERLKIQKENGQITAVEGTTLTGASNLRADEVMLGDTIYKTGKINAKDYLGYRVTAYLTEDTSDDYKTIVLIMPQKNKNNLVQVKADQIHSDTNKKNFVYWIGDDVNGKKEELTISATADIIYNGKAWIDFSAADLKPVSGEVALLDSDDDGDIDIIFVTEYENYIVDRVHSNSYQITPKYNKPILELPLDRNDYKISIVKDGQAISLEEIQEWDVLSIASSKDKKTIKVVVVQNKIKGKIDEQSDDRVMINNVLYEIAPDYQGITHGIQVGDEGIFYLDIEGKIVSADSTVRAREKYAYLIKATPILEGVSKDRAKFKIVDENGDISILDSAEKMMLNGQTRDNKNRVYTGNLVANDDIIKDNPQLITYVLNGEGKLREINTATDKTKEENYIGYFENIFTRDYINADIRCLYNMLGAKYAFDDTTSVFFVPDDKDDDTQFSKGNIVHTQYYNVEIYDATEEKMAGAIIINGKAGADIDDKSAIVLIDQVTQTLNANKEETYGILGFGSGMQIRIAARDQDVKNADQSNWGYTNKKLHELTRGDVVQLEIDNNGEVKSFRTLLALNEADTFKENGSSGDSAGPVESSNKYNYALYTAYGKILGITSKYLQINAHGDGTDHKWDKIHQLSTNINVYICEIENKKIIKGSLADVRKNDVVFVRTTSSSVNDIIIYR
ncbi:MAG: S-layer homology domain-containing protein [Firmicutes bacterium]|nr:S-layer homology domain-containing protein [Bacillota bacterium]